MAGVAVESSQMCGWMRGVLVRCKLALLWAAVLMSGRTVWAGRCGVGSGAGCHPVLALVLGLLRGGC